MALSSKIGKISRKVLMISLYLIGGIIGLFALVWVALQFPSVQTYATGKLTNWLSDKIQTRVSIRRVDIDFFKTIVLEGVYIEDRQKDTLLYTDELKVNIGVLGLRNQNIVVNAIGLDDALVNLKKAEGQDKFNYEVLLEAFQSDTTSTDTTSSGWKFDVEQVALHRLRFNYADAVSRNDLRLSLQKFETSIETLGLEDQHPRINRILLDGLNVAFEQPAPDADTLGAALQKVTQTDTIAAAVKQSVTKSPSGTSKQDSLFNNSGYALNLGEIQIINSVVHYEVKGAPRVANQFDYRHLSMQDLNLVLKNLVVGENSFAVDLPHLAFKDKSGLILNELTMNIKADMPRMEVRLNKLRTPNSALDDVLVVLSSISDTQHLLSKVRLEGNFKEDSLAVQDAALFTNSFDSYPAMKGKKLFLDGKLRMANANVTFDEFRLALNEQQYVTGGLSAESIDSLSLTTVNLHLRELKTDIGFIKQFLPEGTLPAEANTLGNMVLRADVSGKLSGAKAKVALTSGIGQLSADLNLRTNERFDHNTVSGIIRSDNLNAAKLVGNGLGTVAFVLTADASQIGNQFAVRKADLLLKKLVYDQYTYRNMRLNGTYLNNQGAATLVYHDDNLQLQAKLAADMRPRLPHFNLNAVMDKIDPRQLKLTTDTLQASATLAADLSGLNPDEMAGRVTMTKVKVNKAGKTIGLDTLLLTAARQDGIRTINLDADVLKAGLSGRFTVAELPSALNLLVKDYFSQYSVPTARLTSPQSVEFFIAVKSNPALIEALVPGLKIPKPINLKGSFNSKDSRLIVDGTAPLVSYQDQQVEDFTLTSRTNERKLLLVAKAKRISISDSTVVPEPAISVNFKKDDATFNLKLAGAEADSRLNLNGQLLIRQDTFHLRMLPSEIFIKKQKWDIAENALITYGPDYIWIDNFIISQGNQRLAITSQRLSASNTLLNMEVRQFNLGEMLTLIEPLGYELDGELNGKAHVSDLFGKPEAQADLKLDGFAINKNKVGDISLQAGKAAESEQLNLAADVQSEVNDISLKGAYNTVQEENNLNFRLNIGKIKLEQFAVFAKDYVSQLAGDLRAELTIGGSTKKPTVNGSIMFNDVLINALAINVPYRISQQTINFRGDRLDFNKFTIQDDMNQTAVLSGGVNFADLDFVAVDMQFDTDAFRFLNTNEGNKQPVYGDVYAGTNLTMKGPVENLVIDGTVRILDNTELGVPILDGSNEISQADYIHFASKTAKPPAQGPAQKAATSASGFTLNTRIRVSPGAVMRIVIDQQSGDALVCSGRADLKVAMNPDGDINLVGDYLLEKGSYSMTLFGLVKKEFEIEKGSTISWTGDPTNAKVDITAIYHARAPRYELVADQSGLLNAAELQAAKTPAPVSVYLKMQGELLEPTISFDLTIPQSYAGRLDDYTNNALTQIKSNESDLYKQVFGLIALNRFILENKNRNDSGGGLSTGDAVNEKIGQSVSELLTSQLNKLSDDYLGGVQINVDLKSRTEGTYSGGLNDKQLAINLTKQLFNDRLTVSVGSNVGLGSTSNTGGTGANANVSDVKNVIGDFSIQYRLVQSGRINLRFFRKLDPNILNATSNEIIGISILHTKSFNNIKDLYRIRKRKKQERPEVMQ